MALKCTGAEFKRSQSDKGRAMKATDRQIRAWAERHDINRSPSELRQIFEDAQTLVQPQQDPADQCDLESELAEADRRAGAAERRLEQCQEDLARLHRVRDQMKDQWGVGRNVSFDQVWAEALQLKREAAAAR